MRRRRLLPRTRVVDVLEDDDRERRCSLWWIRRG